MRPIVTRIGIGVGLATLVVVIVGFLLPGTYTVSRTVTINAEIERVHYYIGDLEQWDQWTPWVKADPTIVTTFGDKTTGVGAHQSWTGDSGNGALTFTRSDPTKGVAYEMTMEEGKHESQATMEYTRSGDATDVAWVMVGQLGNNPFNRYFGLMMDPMIGPMFEDGLNRLKLLAEKDEPLVGAPLAE